ncbi:hypothetical protein LtaPh_3439000 [Leishmania tarentolae]|uniref:Uncharacterized protein n=1 Tax=Leishmania tarentolae TaxID=5689 RepID=A0A640KTK9_LEITA|nr:hypothetical protein LtaPh_3439000 [Leishmania tarentolae]
MNYHRTWPILSSHLQLVRWTAISPQILFFCTHGNWVGWTFSLHN